MAAQDEIRMPNIVADTYTVFWRELKRYRKSRSGIVIRMIQPAIWIIVIGHTFAGTQPLLESVGFDGKYIDFMAPGVIILTAIFTSIFGGVNTLWDRRYGFISKTLTSPISRSAVALGKMGSISLVAAMQAGIILAIALIIGVDMELITVVPIMGIVVLFSLGFSGISVSTAALAKSQETFWGLINFLGMPLFMLSPALFPLELLPEWLATIARFNPVTYAIILVRDLMSGTVVAETALLAIGIIAGFVAIMVTVTTLVFMREVSRPF